MKRLFTIIFLFCLQTAFGQWNMLTQVDSTMNYLSVHCTNDSTTFIAGYYIDNPNNYFDALIMRTQDGGNTWDTTHLTPFADFRSIHFPTPDTGYAVGEPKLIAKTTDGGDTWNVLNTDSLPGGAQILKTVFFTSADTGFIGAADQGAYMGKTTDGGITWTDLSSGAREIHFPSSMVGYTYGGNEKTIDGGNNWSFYGTIPNPGGGFFCINFANDSVGFAGGGGTTARLSKTVDGAQNWNTQTLNMIGEITAIDMVSDSVGYACGLVNLSNRIFVKTIDQGKNWYPQDVVGQSLSGYDVHCASDSVCYGVSIYGLIYKTTNGGGPLIGLGLKEREEQEEITLYPNPTTSQFTVSCVTCPAAITLFDVTGRQMLSQNIPQGGAITVSHLPKGIYLWQIGEARGKLLKQ